MHGCSLSAITPLGSSGFLTSGASGQWKAQLYVCEGQDAAEEAVPAVDEGSSLLTDTEQAEALGQDGLTPRLANGSPGGSVSWSELAGHAEPSAESLHSVYTFAHWAEYMLSRVGCR